MALQLTWGVWLHGHHGGGVREHVDDVPGRVLPVEGVPLKEHAVHVHFGAEPKGVPNHGVAGAHVQSAEVPVHEAVHGCGQTDGQADRQEAEAGHNRV